ncbi:Endoglucanase, partial [Durusdinium trenchii]
MAPKKKDAVQDELQDGPVEEEEPGPGKVVFNFSAEGVKNLPGELQTLLGFSGFCKEFRTGPSAEPSAWEFTKDSVIRLQNQDLYNDVVERPLVISISDAGAENALIGSAEISLVPLLHDATEVALDLELNLVPEYYARWWKDDEADDPKKKDKKDKAATEVPKEKEPLFEGDAPPSTVLAVTVKVEALVGPEEDRDCWTILTLATEGIFALPESLCSLGVVSPDDFQAHPITYTASLLGESFGEGSLTKAPE